MEDYSHSGSTGDHSYEYSVDYRSSEDFECNYEGRNIFIFNFILTVFGFLSAAILVSILIFKRQLRSSQYLLLNMLILSFLLQLIISGIVYTEEAFDPCWRAGRFFCLLIKFAEPILMHSVVVFLIAVAVQQLRRYLRGRSHTSYSCPIGIVLWLLVLVLSSPEIIFAISEPTRPNTSPIHLCHVSPPTLSAFLVLTSKQVLLEYICPLLVLYINIVVIAVLRARSSRPDGDATDEPGLTHTPLKFLALLTAITITCTIGYFPHYAFQLSTVIMRLNPPEGKVSDIWGNLQTISTLFALIPPAFVPVLVVLLSRPHLNATIEFAQSIGMRIRGSGWRAGRIQGGDQEEEAMTINMNQL